MPELGVLEPGHHRHPQRDDRDRRARRRRRARDILVAIAVGLVGLLAFMVSAVNNPATAPPGISRGPSAHAATPTRPPAPHAGYTLAPAQKPLRVKLKQPPRSGLLFDVRSGRVLWERDPNQSLPIASLTKMMTAIVVVAHSRPGDRVLITRAAVHFSGSGVGLLPRGKRVSLLPLLYGLLLPSGNDAAIALAQHVAHTQAQFISMMNVKGEAMALRCTHFSTVSGVQDRGNYSCATDLAVIAHAVLEQRLLGRIVASQSAILPFPIKGKKLFLYNNNPLMYLRYPGVDGVKTGYTEAAGPCLVAAARRGRLWFGVVLLHSVNPAGQAQQLLNAAFASAR
jgi:serine-type D-Ala-D-Ala carboxypeptidase (penicillin-binding protein 5/6)